MKILGISAYYHDSAAALVERRPDRRRRAGGALHAQEARRRLPAPCRRLLPARGRPAARRTSTRSSSTTSRWVKFERMLETYLGFAPRGLRSFLTAMPLWLKEKLNLKSLLKRELAVARRRQARRLAAAALHRASPGARRLGLFPEPVRARRGALPRRRRRMGDDFALARRGQSADRRSGRSTFRTRSACSTRPSPTTPASRSTRASTS